MRKVALNRKTKEVDIRLELNIDGTGKYRVNTGIQFLDHMLSLFTRHALFNLNLKVKGDLGVDLHHTNEDVGIALGQAFYKALGQKVGIKRFAATLVTMDESLVRCALDLGGRPYLKIKPKKWLGPKTAYTYSHFKQFLKAFVDYAKINLHIDVLEGEDLHHVLEASFKALGLALKDATRIEPRRKGIPTTKGKMD
jgi:imidazoleglycerol-phosphate dehydratase